MKKNINLKEGMSMYRSHKVVWAFKIKEVVPAYKPELKVGKKIGAYLKRDGGDDFTVSIEYYKKHKPEAGGYFVVYEDGYMSWSPAEAFESGYTKMGEMREVDRYSKTEDMISKFKNGRNLFQKNATFNKAVQMLVRGEDVYRVLEQIIVASEDVSNALNHQLLRAGQANILTEDDIVTCQDKALELNDRLLEGKYGDKNLEAYKMNVNTIDKVFSGPDGSFGYLARVLDGKGVLIGKAKG